MLILDLHVVFYKYPFWFMESMYLCYFYRNAYLFSEITILCLTSQHIHNCKIKVANYTAALHYIIHKQTVTSLLVIMGKCRKICIIYYN